MNSQRIVRIAIGICAGLLLVYPQAQAQDRTPPSTPVQIPKTATTLEGLPSVRIDSTEEATTRRTLDKAEADQNRLKVRVRNGRFFWLSREDRPLTFNAEGEYTFLSSTPGSYIKFTKINDRISYVEHIEQGPRSTTFIGELRIVIGK